jgi:hypothetical protein
MAKGGFLVEMLASKNASTDLGYLWRFLYYMYVALPLLVLYFILYSVALAYLLNYLRSLVGISQTTGVTNMTWQEWAQTVGFGMLFSVLLFHFRVLPILFIPVQILTSV